MEIASQMENVIHLEVGEPSFTTPSHIIDAAARDARDGFTKYTSNFGIMSLRQAIATHYSTFWSRPVNPDQVLVTAGGINAIMSAIYAMVQDGDEVLIPDPGWPNYVGVTMLARAVPVRYPLRSENGYLPDLDDLEKLVTSKTKILLMCNPSNPTGAVFPAEAVRALVEFAQKHDLYVISDEIYEALIFEGVHVPASAFDVDGRVLTVSGFSKTYAMTGWRLGYSIASPELIRAAGKLMELLVSCASSVSQRAGQAAISGPQDCVDEMRAAYKRRRDIAQGVLEPAGLLPTVPHGAFYAMADLRVTGMISQDLSRRLLEEERVATAPGDTFGQVSEGMIRLSLASSDADVTAGTEAIVRFADRHALAGALRA
jgi:aspartate/methionine/tyrosine aminotransferase